MEVFTILPYLYTDINQIDDELEYLRNLKKKEIDNITKYVMEHEHFVSDITHNLRVIEYEIYELEQLHDYLNKKLTTSN